MRSRKDKKARAKDTTRFRNEKLIKCETCKFLFNGICEISNIPRHKNETRCIDYKAIQPFT